MLATAALQAADQMTTYAAMSGSKMRIEGTANIIHPTWQIEGPVIGGLMEVGKGFPTEPGAAATPGKVEATASVFIPVRSLKSVEKDGKPYSDRMDQVTYDHLKAKQYNQITYKLTELVLKEGPKTNGAPYLFDSTGDLTIAGTTNTIKMPVSILPVVDKGDKKLEVNGTYALKMTDYKVEPVDINLIIGHIKTGNDVKLIFKWILAEKKTAAASK